MFEDSNFTTDLFLGGKIKLIQHKKGYRAGTDPVLLASAIKAKPNQNILDVGSGNGVAALCLAARIDNVFVTGIEKQKSAFDLAVTNAELNNLKERVGFICADIKNSPSDFAIKKFDWVMTNPPFGEDKTGVLSPDLEIASSKFESSVNLNQWLDFCITMLKPNGYLCMIYSTERLSSIITRLNKSLGGITIIPIWSKPGKDAKRVIVIAKKNSKASSRLKAGLIMHNEDGSYTGIAENILRNGYSFPE